MRYNLQFPNRAAKFLPDFLGGGRLGDFGRLAEEAGFDAVSVYDHPFPTDEFSRAGGHLSLDPFVSLGALAESTTRVRLLTNVLVIPYRSPYIAAHALASVDQISGGRVIAGVAPGYLQGEFEALGAAYDGRGSRLDEAIAAMREVWASAGSPFRRDGTFAVPGNTMFPPPAQPSGPPVWTGGNSRPAMRRAVELADGWLPIPSDERESAIHKSQPIADVVQLAARVADVQRRRSDLGKPPLEICFSPFERSIKDWREAVAAIADRVGAYEEAGATWLTIVATARTLAQLRDDLALFADTVIAGDRSR